MKSRLLLLSGFLTVLIVFYFVISDNSGSTDRQEQIGTGEKQIYDRKMTISADGASEKEEALDPADKIVSGRYHDDRNKPVEPQSDRVQRPSEAEMARQEETLDGTLREAYDEIPPAEPEAAASGEGAAEEEEEEAPPCINMIVDLDYNTDVDDVVALRIATQLNRYERIKLKAVMASTAGDKVCAAMHAQLSHDGCGGVPIGMAARGINAGSPYWKVMTDTYFTPAGYKLYDSLSLYKKILAECVANEEKVRIVTTGYLVNIEDLLKDPQGYQLFVNAVDELWITGGAYPRGIDHNFAFTDGAKQAAYYVSQACPVPIVYSSSYSINDNKGNVIMAGGFVPVNDPAKTDPVTLAFKAYEDANNEDLSSGRFAWDPFCVWAAALTEEETMTHKEFINTWVDPNGSNEFFTDKYPNSRILMRNHDDMGWYSVQLEAWDVAGICGFVLPDYAYTMGMPNYDLNHPRVTKNSP